MKINKILIVEDEKLNADRLKRLLLDINPHLEILSVEDSIASTIHWLQNNETPDIIMMDIRLSDGLSFEIFNNFDVECPVIFTTAYDEYAVQAFKFNSIDYLLKPIDLDELKDTFKRYEDYTEKNTLYSSAIENLLNYVQPQNYRKRFLLTHRDGYKTILTENILYFNTENGINKATLLTGKKEIIPQTLEDLEKQLDPALFFRANRQFIIHIDAVEQIFNHFNGKLKIELKKQNEVDIIISREKASLFKSWLGY